VAGGFREGVGEGIDIRGYNDIDIRDIMGPKENI
jgi:hypothetical protein